ncbi:ubiquitin-like domain-containing protein [Piscibacillus sp. B03]|uniref:ubiquitin-like domain-containing protein n=1 Tax=Piscibacillus sp. B03 TaxID=3457430 RepID=UPI003FCDA374
MSVKWGANPRKKQFSFKKILLTLLTIFVFVATVSYIAFETVTAEVSVIQDGEEVSTLTTANEVSGVMDELGIEVSEHDDLSVDLDDEITDGMVIEYTQAKEVQVTIDDQTETYFTTTENVNQFLEEESINLSEHDELSVDLNTDIEDGLAISIQKAFEVTVNDGGKETTAMVTNQSIGDLLKDLKISLNEHDRLNADLDDRVENNRSIEIVRVTKEKVSKEIEIPYDTETKNDSNLLQGKSKVLTKGEQGKKVETYEVTKENGEEVSRELVDEEVVKESVNQIVAKGTKQPVQQVSKSSDSNSSSSSSSSGDWMTFRSTKYTANCSGCSGYTATGVNVNNTITYQGMRIIAVDPNVIPLRSIVEVRTPSGSFTAIALDTGGAIKGNKIDILVDSKSEAYNWGNRSVQVRIKK